MLLLLRIVVLLAAAPADKPACFVCLLAGFWLCMQLAAAQASRLRLSQRSALPHTSRTTTGGVGGWVGGWVGNTQALSH